MKRLKQLLISSLILGGGIFCNQAWALEQVDGVYQIGTAQDLIDFATGISNGSISNAANAVLTADIDMTDKSWTPIGDNDHRYIGTFDGQYHTIDNLKATGSTNFGIFGVVNGGCVIKNLIAGPNNEIKGISQIGGIIGCSNGSGWVTLENVGHEGSVEGSGANCCAIIGVVVNGGPATRITNCYNTGDIRAERESAIIAGWFGGHSSVEVKGFFNTGLVHWGQDIGKSLWRNGDHSITTERIYNINTDQGATVIEDGQLASGALAYLLNGDNLAGVWHQTIGTDAHPVPDASHGIVRKMQDGSYVNRILVGGYYEMAWGEDLKWFADFVKAGNTTAKAKFVSDIDMTDYSSFLGIGAGDASRFNGEIDGQEHKIKNWKVSASDKVGLVRVGGGGLTLRNMTIDGTCSIVGKGCTAAFVADMNGSNNPVTLSNLGNEADVTGEQNASGILGCNYNGSIVITMTNCYNTGNITATKEGGALSGWLGANAKVYNCYNTGSITNGVGLFRGNGSYTNENTYSTVGNNGGGDNNAEAKEKPDAEKFKDGTVFAKLFDYTYTNADLAVNGNVWRMEFSGTPHPVLYDAAMVLKEDFPNRPKSGRTGNVSLYRTIKQGGWNTFCVPFNMSSAQITAYFGAGTEVAVLDESKNGSDDVLHFKVVDEIEAGQAYLVYPGVAADFSSKAIEGVTISATSPQEGITQAGFTFKGVYEPTALVAAEDRIVVSGNKIVKTTGGSLKGFRAYFKPTDDNARATRFVIDDDDEVTGIITAEGEVIMDQPVYNLRGQRVQEGNSSSRGLLIKGGKKYVKM